MLNLTINALALRFHAGAEVAQYTAEKFPAFLKTVKAYTEGQMATALEEAFLGFDATLTSDDVKQQLAVLAGGEKDPAEEDEDAAEGK
jgi:protein phosphatase 1G